MSKFLYQRAIAIAKMSPPMKQPIAAPISAPMGTVSSFAFLTESVRVEGKSTDDKEREKAKDGDHVSFR